MYSVVLMMALSGGADAVECGRHRGGCDGGAPVVAGCTGCQGGAPVAPAPCCEPAPAPVGCNGGGCDGGCGGRHGHGLFGGGLFRRHKKHGAGCDGGCAGSAPAPVVAPCSGCSASVAGSGVIVARSSYVVTPVAAIPARVGAPVVVNTQPVAILARR